MARQAPIIADPLHPPSELFHIADIQEPPSWLPGKERGTWSFYGFDGLLVVADHGPSTNPQTGERKYLVAQREFPIGVARWIVEQLEPFAGESMFVGDLTIQKTLIADEEIMLVHSPSGGGPDVPGYVLTNGARTSRHSRVVKQSVNMSDAFLFTHGLFDMWKQIADRHERGEF